MTPTKNLFSKLLTDFQKKKKNGIIEKESPDDDLVSF